MKILKRTAYAMIFLFGFTAMSNVGMNDKSTDETVVVPCSTMYTICDYAAPDSFDDFNTCMTRNGC